MSLLVPRLVVPTLMVAAGDMANLVVVGVAMQLVVAVGCLPPTVNPTPAFPNWTLGLNVSYAPSAGIHPIHAIIGSTRPFSPRHCHLPIVPIPRTLFLTVFGSLVFPTILPVIYLIYKIIRTRSSDFGNGKGFAHYGQREPPLSHHLFPLKMFFMCSLAFSFPIYK